MAEQKQQSEGITWVSPQTLIQLRQHASKLPLDNSKIHARQGGAYLSSFKGRGMEFDESRIYLPGDDIRNMDWKVTARTGDPHTKIYCEERERPVLLWLDLNPSMFFATRGAFKSVVATKAASLLAWSAAAHNDRMGALIFSGDEHTELRPRRGKSAVLDFIRRSCEHSAWQNHSANNSSNTSMKPVTRNMATAMSRLRKVSRPGSLIFLLSDFREMDQQAESHLINIARHNDVVLLQIFDPIETQLPDSGYYKVSDGHSECSLNTASAELREHYHQRYTLHQEKLLQLCRQHRMHLVSLSTEDETLQALQKGLGINASKNSQYRAL